MSEARHRTCTQCVLDTTVASITFDENGVCNFCHEAQRVLPACRYTPEQEEANLAELARRIKATKRGKYDSIMGLSGGVDSSYTAYLAKRMGLNPLCVHFDNGWNSEIAVSNIENIVRACGFDLATYVIDWPEFRDLQRAFLRAGVIDLEMLSDHAISASLFKLRREHHLTYVLSGTNHATEHGLPDEWVWFKADWRNIKAIHRAYGEQVLRTFPHMDTLRWLLIRGFNLGGIYAEPLNLVTYRKDEAMRTLEREFGWRYYGGKHYESTITKFYQAYILPTKFGVDKRKAHLSALIRNGEMTREAALAALATPLYNREELSRDMDFVLKKLGFTMDEFVGIMNSAPRRHDDYATEQTFVKPLMRVHQALFRRDRRGSAT